MSTPKEYIFVLNNQIIPNLCTLSILLRHIDDPEEHRVTIFDFNEGLIKLIRYHRKSLSEGRDELKSYEERLIDITEDPRFPVGALYEVFSYMESSEVENGSIAGLFVIGHGDYNGIYVGSPSRHRTFELIQYPTDWKRVRANLHPDIYIHFFSCGGVRVNSVQAEFCSTMDAIDPLGPLDVTYSNHLLLNIDQSDWNKVFRTKDLKLFFEKFLNTTPENPGSPTPLYALTCQTLINKIYADREVRKKYKKDTPVPKHKLVLPWNYKLYQLIEIMHGSSAGGDQFGQPGTPLRRVATQLAKNMLNFAFKKKQGTYDYFNFPLIFLSEKLGVPIQGAAYGLGQHFKNYFRFIESPFPYSDMSSFQGRDLKTHELYTKVYQNIRNVKGVVEKPKHEIFLLPRQNPSVVQFYKFFFSSQNMIQTEEAYVLERQAQGLSFPFQQDKFLRLIKGKALLSYDAQKIQSGTIVPNDQPAATTPMGVALQSLMGYLDPFLPQNP